MKVQSAKQEQFVPVVIQLDSAEEVRGLLEILATAKEWRTAMLESKTAHELYSLIHQELDER